MDSWPSYWGFGPGRGSGTSAPWPRNSRTFLTVDPQALADRRFIIRFVYAKALQEFLQRQLRKNTNLDATTGRRFDDERRTRFHTRGACNSVRKHDLIVACDDLG